MTAIIPDQRVDFSHVGHLSAPAQVVGINAVLPPFIKALQAHELASQHSLTGNVDVITSDSESSEESEQVEVALKVSFYVNGPCFRFNDSSALRQRGYDVTSETTFFDIGVQEHTADNVDVWKLQYIPVDLVEKALSNPDRTVHFTWNDREIDLRFIEKGKMTEDTVLDRIQDIKNGQFLQSLDMPPSKILFYVNRTYMPKIA